MENVVVIKMKKAYYPQNSDIRKLMRYIAGETETKEKARYCNGRGLPPNCNKAANAIIKIQELYEKTKQRRIYHLIVSFPQEVDDVNFVKIVAEDIADILYSGKCLPFVDGRHQVYYGVHEDAKCLHIHVAINAVSYVDGKKWHQSTKEFEGMKKIMQKRISKIKNEFM